MTVSAKLPSNKVIDTIMCEIEGATLAQIIDQILSFNPLAAREQVRKKILDYTSHKLHLDPKLREWELMRWCPVPPPGEELVGHIPVFTLNQTTDEIEIDPEAPRATYWLFEHLSDEQLERVKLAAERDIAQRLERHRKKLYGIGLYQAGLL